MLWRVSFEPVDNASSMVWCFVFPVKQITECCVGMLCLLSKSASKGGSMVQTLLQVSESFEKGGEMKLKGSFCKGQIESKRRYSWYNDIYIYWYIDLHSWTIPVGCMRCSLIHHVFDDLKFFSIRAQRTCQHWNQLFVQILVLVQAFLALVRTKLWMHIAGPTAIKLQAIQVPWWRNDHQHPSLLKPACFWTEDSSSCGLLMGAYLQAYISIHFLFRKIFRAHVIWVEQHH